MTKLSLALVSSLVFGGSIFGGEKTFNVSSGLDLRLGGALSGGYISTNNNPDRDSFVLTNVLVTLTGTQKGVFEVNFDVALGGLAQPSFWNGGMSPPQSFNFNTYGMDRVGIGPVWSYLTLNPSSFLSLDVGLLPTNVGYEVANTYSNPNVILGTVWFAQPVIYPAIRATVSTGSINLYAEYNQEFGGDNFAIGSVGEIGALSYAVSYYDYKNARNLIDVVGSFTVGIIDLGLNLDYQWLDNRAGRRGYAYGIALYAIPNMGNIKLPVRVEYFDEADTGIYTGAPTRSNVFGNLDKNTRTILSLEIGVTF